MAHTKFLGQFPDDKLLAGLILAGINILPDLICHHIY